MSIVLTQIGGFSECVKLNLKYPTELTMDFDAVPDIPDLIMRDPITMIGRLVSASNVYEKLV